MRRTSIALLLSLLLTSLLLVSVDIREAKASGTVYIRADGSIDPADAPIQRDGETYTFTDDLNGTIIVERDHITVDGSGYLLQGNGNESGIEVSGRLGVTIRNVRFMSFSCGVWFNCSSHCMASANKFTNCTSGFWFYRCSNNTINGNNMTGNVYGVYDGMYPIGVISSNNNTISGNYVDDCGYGIYLFNSSNNIIRGNSVALGYAGVFLYGHYGNSSNENIITDNTLTDNVYGIKSEDYNNNNMIRNNTIAQSRIYGIALWIYSDNNTVCDNNITPNGCPGIRLNHSSNTTITGNSFAAGGISGWASFYNNISENEFLHSSIDLTQSSDNTINANVFSEGGLRVTGSYRNVVEYNTVNSKPLIYFERESNLVVDYEAGQVVLVNCSGMLVENLHVNDTNVGVLLCRTNNTEVRNNAVTGSGCGIETNSRARNNRIHGNVITANSGYGLSLSFSSDTRIFENTLANNAGGVSLSSSSNITIVGNNVTTNQNTYGIFLEDSLGNDINKNLIRGNWGGLKLDQSSNNTIRGNCITANSYYGISLHEYTSPSANNIITGNKIAGNWIGIEDDGDSSTNAFYHNDLVDNTEQIRSAYGWSLGTYDDGYPSGGNYWSDYPGSDVYSGPFQNETGSDGIGDTPYTKYSEPLDRYPLMAPYPWTPHDIGIGDLKPQRDIVGQIRTLPINVTLVNYGNNTEAFTVTVYVNDTPIATSDTIVLASRDHTTLTFTWNTTGLDVGTCTLTAEVSTLPDDVDMLDNTMTDWVLITIPGDVDGDRDVDIFDIVRIAGDYGKPPPPLNDINCDIDGDGDVDIFDLVAAAGHYGESW